MYQALYRKYRPVDFDSVVGQDSIIKTLKNSIINHNFSLLNNIKNNSNNKGC